MDLYTKLPHHLFALSSGHLYRRGAKRAQERKFEARYGKKKGKRVYGAVVGKVYRETHHGHNWNEGKRYKERGYLKTKKGDPPAHGEYPIAFDHGPQPTGHLPAGFDNGPKVGLEDAFAFGSGFGEYKRRKIQPTAWDSQ
jgi:hypothetical protein